jgi:aspartate/tyrosine/aromatic aminotransferase
VASRQDDAARLASAEREVEVSRQRLHNTREQVVKPLRAAAERNNFAQLIAQSLAQGHRKGGAA